MQARHIALIAGLAVAIAGTGGTLWWLYRAKPPAPAPYVEAPAPETPPASAPRADAGPKHPIEPLAAAGFDVHAAHALGVADGAGRDSVHPHASGAPLHREAFGHLIDSGLRCAGMDLIHHRPHSLACGDRHKRSAGFTQILKTGVQDIESA